MLALAWFGLFIFQLVALPGGWSGIEEYAQRFTPAELANLWPALFLGWAFLLMLAALHYLVPGERRAWTLSALALGVIYATMETINYTIQIVAIAPNLSAGELERLHLWIGANFDSVFWALALCYGLMALSMLLAAPAIGSSGPQRWVRRFFIVGGASAPFQFGWGLFDWPDWVCGPGTLLWLVGLVGASIALARVFRSHLAYLDSHRLTDTRAFLEVDVVPAQTEQLTSPHPGCGENPGGGEQPMSGRSLQKRL